MSLFVSFEGIDLSGKSTQADLLARFLRNSGRSVVAAREPGGTALGEAARELLLHGEHVEEWAEAALFVAARAQLVYEVIEPALARGDDVVCDRFLDSSLAYQGVGRGLGIDRILEMNHAAIGDLRPILTFVLLLSPDQAYSRMPAQLTLIGDADGNAPPPDRIEREEMAFRQRVDKGYRELIDRFPERLVALDGTLPRKELARMIRDHVAARLSPTESRAVDPVIRAARQ